MIVYIGDGYRLPVVSLIAKGEIVHSIEEADTIVASLPDGNFLATQVFEGELIESKEALQ